MVGDLESYCFASQQIREAIESGKIVSEPDESRIQPSSFEPTVGSDVFILDTEVSGLFRAKKDQSVYKTLLELPKRQREKIDICNGYELKKGFTYLLPLNEKIRLCQKENVRFSPKSSLGRVFLNTRILGDFNPCFNELNSQFCGPECEIDLWLYVQPLAFNVIMHPGLTLNQLRFFHGLSAQLTPEELVAELKKKPILYKREDDREVPADNFVSDGLEVHLDILGKHTESIVGLRARHNPEPIDLSKKDEYDAEDFFEPLKAGKKMSIKRGEYYLLASKEILWIPDHLNAELRSHSHIGFTGPLHFAGFIDNGFKGDLVFEVRSDEVSSIELEDGMPVSKLDVFKTIEPDKVYGKDIGSNYQLQIGARPAKYFKAFDFKHAAKNYDKLDRIVLVQDANLLKKHRFTDEGFEFLQESPEALYNDVNEGFWHSRYDCEDDELVLQLIPYVLLFGENETVFSYQRAKSIEHYGDKRLFGKYSFGLGGHIVKKDGPAYIKNCIEREVFKEEIKIQKVVELGGQPKMVQGKYTEPALIGTLVARDKPVDRVHFGLIFASHVDGKIVPNEKSMRKESAEMIPIKDLIKDKTASEKYETWSKILIPYLNKIYEE